MKTRQRACITIALLLCAFATHGEVYQCPAADGSASFTDKPCKGGSVVDVETNSSEAARRVYSSAVTSPYPVGGRRSSKPTEYDKLMARRDRRTKEKNRRIDNTRREAAQERRHQDLVDALRAPLYGGYYRRDLRDTRDYSRKRQRSRATFAPARK